MAYITMKKLILNAKAHLSDGSWEKEQYEVYRESTQRKLDVFYANNRLTENQYEELTGMWA